ncbi:winged helix-turn-helix transcriptional regulator [Streptosporangium sp. NPDC000396]|uniref:winged helix-turn-helix transcriptional regulator n=1 Tax=Streptosporangium sp. NPDC000396 TaxID=3366185 RepID=UPI00367E3E50
MDWTTVDLANCPLIRAMEVVGKQWTLIVLREAFNGVQRFEDFQRHLGMSRSLLSRRLSEMVDNDLLARVPYREDGARERHAYEPTATAWELYPVLAGLIQWGERHLASDEDSQVRLVDRRSGARLVAALVPEDAPSCPPSEVRVELG